MVGLCANHQSSAVRFRLVLAVSYRCVGLRLIVEVELEAGQGQQKGQLNAERDDHRPLIVVPQLHDIEKHACDRDCLPFGVNTGQGVARWSGHLETLMTAYLRDAVRQA